MKETSQSISMYVVTFILLITLPLSCKKSKNSRLKPIKTENVVILVMDGARYSETWGDSTHQYIPNMAIDLAPQGVINTAFENQGPTVTVAGHTAMTTGVYQAINNEGNQLPDKPSFFQYWLNETESESTDAWVISSKDKLEVLTDCMDPDWAGHHMPSSNCGINGEGVGSGYRHDSLTYSKTIEILENFHPRLLLVNFREPDFTAHQGDWQGYLDGIQNTDEYIYGIQEFLSNDPFYHGTTSIFVTNDHGRHLDGVGSGFSSHGDDCEGCRHIFLFAQGPDFKKNLILNDSRSLVDITATIAHLLDIEMPYSTGEVMEELFE